MTYDTASPLLPGTTAIVTGSTSGIGAAIASTLARAGAHVVLSGRDAARGRAVADEIAAAGGRADVVAVDLAGGYADLRAFTTEATAALGGRVDLLVLNAGVYPVTATDQLPDAELDAMLAINIRAPHVLVGELAPAMAQRGAGAIVVIGSWMASVGSHYGAMYTATKAADEQLARSWAAEYGRRGVRVNALAPGVTLTPGNESAREALDALTAGTPDGEVIMPQDIADGVLFLASDAARRIHGTTLYVDGGITTTMLG